MAEFCLDCLNKIMELNLKAHHVIFFSSKNICEGCGKEKHCVARFNIMGRIAEKRQYRKRDKQK